jgi:hypothetical protein
MHDLLPSGGWVRDRRIDAPAEAVRCKMIAIPPRMAAAPGGGQRVSSSFLLDHELFEKRLSTG